MPTKDTEPEYLTAANIMARLQLSQAAAYALMAKLPNVKIGRSVRVERVYGRTRPEHIQALIQRAIKDAGTVARMCPEPTEHEENKDSEEGVEE